MTDSITAKTYPAYPAPLARRNKASVLAYLHAVRNYHLGQAERYADLAADAQAKGLDTLVGDYLWDGWDALETANSILP